MKQHQQVILYEDCMRLSSLSVISLIQASLESASGQQMGASIPLRRVPLTACCTRSRSGCLTEIQLLHWWDKPFQAAEQWSSFARESQAMGEISSSCRSLPFQATNFWHYCPPFLPFVLVGVVLAVGWGSTVDCSWNQSSYSLMLCSLLTAICCRTSSTWAHQVCPCPCPHPRRKV